MLAVLLDPRAILALALVGLLICGAVIFVSETMPNIPTGDTSAIIVDRAGIYLDPELDAVVGAEPSLEAELPNFFTGATYDGNIITGVSGKTLTLKTHAEERRGDKAWKARECFDGSNTTTFYNPNTNRWADWCWNSDDNLAVTIYEWVVDHYEEVTIS